VHPVFLRSCFPYSICTAISVAPDTDALQFDIRPSSFPNHPCHPWLPLLRGLCDLFGEMIGAIHLNSESFRELGSVAPIRMRPLLHRILSKTVQFLVPPQKVKNNC
jgi:hypothetical protein